MFKAEHFRYTLYGNTVKVHFALPRLAPRSSRLRNYIPRRVRFRFNERRRRGTRFIGSLGTSLERGRHVIGHRTRRIHLGLAVSIDDNPRERSRGRRASRIIKAVSFEKEMPGDTVTRLWRLHRGIITVAMARFDGERERERERGAEGGAGGSRVMPRIRVCTIMSGDTARGQRA